MEKGNREWLSALELPVEIEKLMEYQGSCVFLQRDDRLPFLGGNKVRLGAALMEDLLQKGRNALIGYGSRDSNFNRVCAFFAKELNIPCRLVCSESTDTPSLNQKLAQKQGATFLFCDKAGVRQKLEQVDAALKAQGFSPYYVYGNFEGRGHEQVLQRGYASIFPEILEKFHQVSGGKRLDGICLAYGTGMTFGGLLTGSHQKEKAGKGKRDLKLPKITGISIAREKRISLPQGEVTAEYLLGGYGRGEGQLRDLILEMAREYHLFLDPVYTGKAFYGMLKEIEKGKLLGNILFIHTGGYPIYLDYRERLREKERR